MDTNLSAVSQDTSQDSKYYIIDGWFLLPAVSYEWKASTCRVVRDTAINQDSKPSREYKKKTIIDTSWCPNLLTAWSYNNSMQSNYLKN